MDTTLIKTLKSLVKNENIDISAFLSNFLSKMLQNISAINANTIHIFELLSFIIDELPLQKHVQNIVNNVFKTLSESRMLDSGGKDIMELRKECRIYLHCCLKNTLVLLTQRWSIPLKQSQKPKMPMQEKMQANVKRL